jgi:hypothetical protein
LHTDAITPERIEDCGSQPDQGDCARSLISFSFTFSVSNRSRAGQMLSFSCLHAVICGRFSCVPSIH